MQIKQLEGKRILLRKATTSDLSDIYYNVWSDLKLTKYMFWTPCTNLSEAKLKLDKTIELQGMKNNFFVEEKKSHQVIGFTGFKEHEDGSFEEQGICIGTAFQHKGYGQEILDLYFDYCFNKMNAPAFYYGCLEKNKKSLGLVSKYPFEYVSLDDTYIESKKKSYKIYKFVLTKEKYDAFRKEKKEGK